MGASEEILLNSLANSGVPIPEGVSSIHDLTSPTLFSISSYALRLIQGPHYASSFPPSLPEDSTPDRVKILTDLASIFNNLGFSPDLSFHMVPLIPFFSLIVFLSTKGVSVITQVFLKLNNLILGVSFLYPSEEDLYKLLRFMVEKLSESSGAQMIAMGEGYNIRCLASEKAVDEGETSQNEEILTGMEDLRLKNEALDSSYMKSQDDLAEAASQSTSNECNWNNHQTYSSGGVESSRKNALSDHHNESLNQEVLKKSVVAKHSELEHANEEQGILKGAVEMVFDGQHPVVFYIEQLNHQVKSKRSKLKELESEWNVKEKRLQEKKANFEQSLFADIPDASGKLAKMKEIELEAESVLAEVKRREEELSKLSSDLEKQTKMALRSSYIERINEITKNSRKQDNDIQRILKDTRELRLESNTTQERLNRTYAIVAETILREAKKDPVAQQAYRLLTDIHCSFEQVAEKLFSTDRSGRDAADYEAKVSILNARGLNLSKLQADLDAIRKENDFLQQQLHNKL